MALPGLNERERRVLEAVIQTYVETAEPAGSRSLAHKFGLGVSPATIRNTMSDLEEKGYLFHPHASAGRVPTDIAYRVYVDSLIPLRPPDAMQRERLTAQITSGGSAVEAILRRAAQSLGVITQELGIALGPRFDNAILEHVELIRLSSERLLVALTLSAGAMRTIFVDVQGEIADAAIAEVTRVLNAWPGSASARFGHRWATVCATSVRLRKHRISSTSLSRKAISSLKVRWSRAWTPLCWDRHRFLPNNRSLPASTT